MLVTSFTAIFLAEIGDKTQLAAFAMAGSGSSKWAVFLGASLALIATTAIAVVAGGIVERHVPAHWVKRGAGALFIVIGVLLLVAGPESSDGAPPEADGNELRTE